MKTLVVRADASTQIGTGHIMRCLALAQAWQNEGGRVVFLSCCESEALRHRVAEANFDFASLKMPHPDPYDFRRTVALLKETEADWLVLDGYHFDPVYQHALREACCRLLVIDDTAHLSEYHADILLNQNINATQLAYHCDPDTTLLLGTRYALLRREFYAWQGWRRQVSQAAEKILVTLGGSDPDNITLKVIQALKGCHWAGIEAKIVVGPSNPHFTKLQSEIRMAKLPMEMLQNVADTAPLMAWADLAISAGGSTCWELAFMGLPTIVLVLAENQRRIAEGLEEAGMAINLGRSDQVSVVAIQDALGNLINKSEERNRMSQAGYKMVDGGGARRVIEAMQANSAVG